MKGPGGAGGPRLVLGASFGILAGAGAVTFAAGEGLSYFSDDPKACANCHVMGEAWDGWQKSAHHGRATCNDCHLPRAWLPRIAAKAENGYRHSRAFTFQDYLEPLRIRPRNREILNANCRECHRDLVEGIPSGGEEEPLDCARCHRDAGHGARR